MWNENELHIALIIIALVAVGFKHDNARSTHHMEAERAKHLLRMLTMF